MSTKEHPILMSAPMIRAILEGRKTQTRRIMKPQPDKSVSSEVFREAPYWNIGGFRLAVDANNPLHCPYGQVGDRLIVRETGWISPDKQTFIYADLSGIAGADGKRMGAAGHSWSTDKMREDGWRLRPSIHMPRWASRSTLEITDIRVQRLQEISEEDAIAEGIWDNGERSSWADKATVTGLKEGRHHVGPVDYYRELWDSINAKRSPWSSNCWVWALTFKRVPQ